MKLFFGISGLLSLSIGVVGVILPILPTTPFLLLSSLLFSKSSDRFSDWFKETKIYKNHLEEFITNRSMTKRKKWTLLIVVDLMLIISMITIDIIILKGLIIILIIAKHIYFHKNIITV